ncbi:MAG: hybrid sensor histidine kinase/response regulator [Cyanobacteria bacterium J06633_2]
MDIQNTGFILIVDDNPVNLEFLQQILEQEGFTTQIASNGLEALEHVSDDPPELILLDIMMPHIDGFETCSRLKALEKTREIPIIFMTALANTESKIRGLSLGAVDYITKPFSHGEVLARVKTHLKITYLMNTLNAKNDELKKEIENRKYVESELRRFNEQLEQGMLIRTSKHEQTTIRLVQQEKLAALRELASSTVSGALPLVEALTTDIDFVQQSYQHLQDRISSYQQHTSKPNEAIAQPIDDLPLNDLQRDTQTHVASVHNSCDRLHVFHQALATFAQLPLAQKVEIDIHDVLNNTLLLLQHHFHPHRNRSSIDVIKQYDTVPMIMGFPDRLGQMFMGLIANAIEAFDERCPEYPSLTIRTEHRDKHLLVHIADNAGGIPPEKQPHIFDYTFTTKQVKSQSGLGLAIIHQIVVDTHAGDLSFVSTPGEGTEFTVSLPVDAK